MPEFKLNIGSFEDGETFAYLDSFTQGYIEGAFFTIDEDLADFAFSDLAPETLAEIISDCADFQKANEALLQRAYDMGEAQGHYHAQRAGTDYWFTRNRHGAGFWDRDLGEVGDELTDAAHKDGETDLYLGDDKKLYLS